MELSGTDGAGRAPPLKYQRMHTVYSTNRRTAVLDLCACSHRTHRSSGVRLSPHIMELHEACIAGDAERVTSLIQARTINFGT